MMFKIYIDSDSELLPLLNSYYDGIFTDMSSVIIAKDIIYIIDYFNYVRDKDFIDKLMFNYGIKIVISHIKEGSDTLSAVLHGLDLETFIMNKQLAIVCAGALPKIYPNLTYDRYLTDLYDREENKFALDHCDEIYSKQERPYDFLFLNGRTRPHRKYMMEKLDLIGLLNRSLWTNLDSNAFGGSEFTVLHNNCDMMLQSREIRSLSSKYECPMFIKNYPITKHGYIKKELFSNVWGEVYINLEPYKDTFFSLVTESAFRIPFSLRSEKIWKPVCLGHPWIAVSNQGFYKDIRNLGFKTYDGLIDESFDNIENNKERCDAIIEMVEDLCKQDLYKFLLACKEINDYNRDHFIYMNNSIRKDFPNRFFHFINLTFETPIHRNGYY